MDAFQVLDVIGEGAYARVHRGVHRKSKTNVAIKFMKQPCASINQSTLLPEVVALSKLQSINQSVSRATHIIKLKSVIVENNRAALVLEYMPCDLLTLMTSCPQGINQSIVRVIATQLLIGVAHCHLHGIIHRDIKLENILIDAPGLTDWLENRGKSTNQHLNQSLNQSTNFFSTLADPSTIRIALADFGESRSVRTCRGSDTHAGTLWSRAPEQLNHQPYSSPIDVWSIGCVVAELLTGRSLFAGNTEIDVLNRISNVSKSRLSIVCPRLSIGACQFLARLLDVNQSTRSKASEALAHEFLQGSNHVGKPAVAIRPSTARPRIESAPISLATSTINATSPRILYSSVSTASSSYRPTTAYPIARETARDVARGGARSRTRLSTAAAILS